MPTTPKHALPYPAGTDPVNQGAANFQALANKLDTENLVPAGGAAGSYLAKTTAADFVVGWVPLGGGWVPAGGAAGAILTKSSGVDYAAGWVAPGGGWVPAGGAAGQVLAKASGADFATLWQTPASGGGGSAWLTLRKTTPTVVVNTVADTELLGGLTIPAGALGVDRLLRLTMRGDYVNNSGGAINLPEWKLKLGGTTVLATGRATGQSGYGTGSLGTSSIRGEWQINATIATLGTAITQWCSLRMDLTPQVSGGVGGAPFATGTGRYVGGNGSGGLGEYCYAQGGAASALDTANALVLAVSVSLGTAASTHDVTLKHAFVEVCA